ncbi:hypothetical protein HMPREF9123_1304 [Neisseria bacilliformis ATCC BAA-1200]|uniref:Uncharacterized protein n=1 Tax=Neisseria bacilliformis ATCC BAA-1200 TaxID=888742 RepID=F2BC49_9NEIS|nr:hypothetical protein HMPREF9123_1304 [Neisseria bacilliformis ATCC BAA-1200]
MIGIGYGGSRPTLRFQAALRPSESAFTGFCEAKSSLKAISVQTSAR